MSTYPSNTEGIIHSQIHKVYELIAELSEEYGKTTQNRKVEYETANIGDKYSMLSPITGFRIQNLFQKPLVSSFQELAITSNNW